MNRREFIQCAAIVAAGCTELPKAWALSGEQREFLAQQPSYSSTPIDFFSPEQRAAITAAVELIIPRTDTPGAIDAGVPRFTELMVANWFSAAERALFMTGLDYMQQLAGGSFAALPAAAQLQILEDLEERAADATWYKIANTLRVWDSGAPYICQLKELCVLGFFLSEVGATQVLRVNPMGSFVGNIALDVTDSAYAAELPLRGWEL